MSVSGPTRVNPSLASFIFADSENVLLDLRTDQELLQLNCSGGFIANYIHQPALEPINCEVSCWSGGKTMPSNSLAHRRFTSSTKNRLEQNIINTRINQTADRNEAGALLLQHNVKLPQIGRFAKQPIIVAGFHDVLPDWPRKRFAFFCHYPQRFRTTSYIPRMFVVQMLS